MWCFQGLLPPWDFKLNNDTSEGLDVSCRNSEPDHRCAQEVLPTTTCSKWTAPQHSTYFHSVTQQIKKLLSGTIFVNIGSDGFTFSTFIIIDMDKHT